MSGIPAVLARPVLRVALIAALLLAVVALRVVTSARAELSHANAQAEQGNLEAAIVHYRRAARWYAPGSPYHVEALDRLAGIAAEAEREGNSERALAAYRAVRGAILSARSFYVPQQARLRAADRRIADLMAAQPPPPMDAGKSREQLRKEHLALLSADPGPDVFWTAVLLLGFVAWLTGAFLLSTRAIDAQDRWIASEALRWGGVVALGFLAFVVGMVMA